MIGTSQQPESSPADARAVEDASQEFVGRWHRLVSSTNWEKGRIICQWRTTLSSAGASPGECSDEAWSERLGRISPQHVGRLRRVHERFGDAYRDYEGLYWSHFQAALDWSDAEMWLEGAVQNRWSIAEMRDARLQTLGTVDAELSSHEENAAEEFDEDAALDERGDMLVAAGEARHTSNGAAEHDNDLDADADTTAAAREFDETYGEEPASEEDAEPSVSAAQPFARLPELPPDLADACEAFKLAILRHKLAGWAEVSAADVLATLAALEQLVAAPGGK